MRPRRASQASIYRYWHRHWHRHRWRYLLWPRPLDYRYAVPPADWHGLPVDDSKHGAATKMVQRWWGGTNTNGAASFERGTGQLAVPSRFTIAIVY